MVVRSRDAIWPNVVFEENNSVRPDGSTPRPIAVWIDRVLKVAEDADKLHGAGVGDECGICKDSNWATDSRSLR